MIKDKVMELLEQTGLPFAYHHFAEGSAPEPPFVVFSYPESNNFPADGKTYQKITKLNIELYTDKKASETENKIEAKLDDNCFFWNKTEKYIQSEKMYEVLYEMEVKQ